MCARTKGSSIVSTNAKGRGGARPSHICGSPECMCHVAALRGQAYWGTDYSKGLAI
jgi:hypothetical protein